MSVPKKTSGGCHNPSYDLSGIVVHYGSGIHYGHYWSLSRGTDPSNKWVEYDDTKIHLVEDRDIE